MKILTETIIRDIMNEVEQGFDVPAQGVPPSMAPGLETPQTTPVNTQGDTNTTDIAQQIGHTFTKNAISQSLPYMMGFVQPLNGPAGFVFGTKQRHETQVTHGLPITPEPDDEIVTRKLVTTEIREVIIDFTNEVGTDMESLFGDHFNEHFKEFQKSGGEVWNGQNEPLANFFLYIGMQRMTQKINKDFIYWIQSVATVKGQSDIANYSEMVHIFGIIAELREALYKNTHKSGSCWILVSPKIASFLSSTIGSAMNNSADVYNQGRRTANNAENGYVLTMGDIDVYQYDFYPLPEVTGGTESDSESEGQIFMGFRGGAGVSSIYYSPYKEYIVQGGEEYYTGQSNVFYKVRDSWCLNPLDTYDESQTSISLPDGSVPDIRTDNKSQYIVKVNITFQEKLIKV